jgi:preprotein translocase subunit SecE
MVSNVNFRNTMFDRILWVLVLTLIVAGIGLNYYFVSQSVLIRAVGLLSLAAIAIFIALQTKQGRNFGVLWLGAIQEVRKMIWPTRQETVQTTLAVVAMVFVMGLLLWTTDFILLRAVAWLTGHWGA